MDQSSEILIPNSNIETIESTKTFYATEASMPWLKPGEKREVKLIEVWKKDSKGDGRLYLFGELVGSRLKTAKMERDTKLKSSTDRMLSAHLTTMAENKYLPVKTLMNPVSDVPIYYFAGGNYRVYFQRHKDPDGLPVFIKIAACDKNDQKKVLPHLVDEARVHTKAALR